MKWNWGQSVRTRYGAEATSPLDSPVAPTWWDPGRAEAGTVIPAWNRPEGSVIELFRVVPSKARSTTAASDRGRSESATLDLPVTLSVNQAADVLGLSRAGTYDAVRRGELPSLRIGRRILIPTRKLIQLLDQLSVARERA